MKPPTKNLSAIISNIDWGMAVNAAAASETSTRLPAATSSFWASLLDP